METGGGSDQPISRGPTCDFDALLHDAQKGRPSAWDQLYRWLAPSIAGYVRLRGAADPEDLTSEVFLAVFRNIGSFAGNP